MNATTATAAIAEASTPARIESAPRSGPTVRSSTTFSGICSAPERSSIASWFALWAVKLPWM